MTGANQQERIEIEVLVVQIEQVTKRDIENKDKSYFTRESCFVLDVPLRPCNLRISMANFVPSDQVV